MGDRYRIVRVFRDRHARPVIASGVTLERAQEHCRDRETSSSTCKGAIGLLRTKRLGPWFDSYEADPHE